LTSRRDKRKQAFSFIYGKLHELDHNLSYNTSKNFDITSIISLADMDKLKRGHADPSRELVVALKNLLHPVVREQEIQDYLVKPFLPKSRLS
jgi:hypothetical protein